MQMYAGMFVTGSQPDGGSWAQAGAGGGKAGSNLPGGQSVRFP